MNINITSTKVFISTFFISFGEHKTIFSLNLKDVVFYKTVLQYDACNFKVMCLFTREFKDS